jgi:signal transduction histidine kinase
VEDLFLKIKNDYSLSGKQIELLLQIEVKGEQIVEIDSQHLQQVIINLFNNAIKFSTQGTILMSIGKTAAHYQISVKDSGMGIPADMLEHIFQPFRQAHEGISRSRGGIGLGLAICKKMVEMWGGSIYVKSTPGKGSTFSFTIPLSVSDAVLV